MPETAMDVNQNLMPFEYQVWRARKPSGVDTEPQARPVQVLPDNQLRARVFRANALHHARASGAVYDVNHGDQNGVRCIYLS
jgi:hypothetical protein